MKLYFILILTLTLNSCKAQNMQPRTGSVFVAEILLKNSVDSIQNIFPFSGFRIDSSSHSNLFVKYKFGTESFMDVDFTFSDSCGCYESNGVLSFSPYGSQKAKGYLHIENSKTIVFYFYENGLKKRYAYGLSYVDSVDFKRSRDIYNAEDGFELFKN